MHTTRMPHNHLGASVVLILAIGAAGCGSSSSPSMPSPNPSTRTTTSEVAATSAVVTALGAVGSTMTGVLVPGAGQKQSWSGSGVSCSSMTVHFLAASGLEQAVYDAERTTRVVVSGTCAAVGSSTTVNMTIDGVQASSAAVVVNGTAVGNYQGMAVAATITDLRVPRQGCAIPTSGEVRATTPEVSASVTFNGTSTATGTYTRGPSSFTFQVALGGCQG